MTIGFRSSYVVFLYSMKYSSIPLAQLVVKHCKAKEVKNIVISPGSRNAPLIIGFTEDPYFSCFSIVDERSAAFFALGIAQKTKEPVAVVCTSGSALLNYYPAVAEAFYSEIPLVVLSADRPPYKIDVGDGQTIRQDHVFHRHIGYSANLKQDISHAPEKIYEYAPQWLSTTTLDLAQKKIQGFNDNELNVALNVAKGSKLPVHINIPFEEPLYDTVLEPSINAVIDPIAIEKYTNVPNIKKYADIWNSSLRKMVLVGVNEPNSLDQRFLDQLAEDPSVIVLTETTSNLHHPNFFSSIDSLIAPVERSANSEMFFKELRPDILLTFGGLIVSKKIKAFLRKYKPAHHWHINEIRAYDTFYSLTYHFKIDPNRFFTLFTPHISRSEDGYYTFWNTKREQYEQEREKYLKQIGFSDMQAFHVIVKNIPKGYQVHLANSSTVRYAQLFDLDASLKVYCNRGTSGIDGSTSTAVGAAYYAKDSTLLITGDLSFFYDSNGLWNNYLRHDFRIILLNNNGGGIFRILPGHEESENFSTYFETAHQHNAEHLSLQYGLHYSLVADESRLYDALKEFYKPGKAPKILEIKTPRLTNDKILLGYFDFISSAHY